MAELIKLHFIYVLDPLLLLSPLRYYLIQPNQSVKYQKMLTCKHGQEYSD